MEQYGVDMLDQLGINNTYCIAVPQSIADQYGLETISDLIPVAGELRFGAGHEFFTEPTVTSKLPFSTAAYLRLMSTGIFSLKFSP